MLSGAPPSPAPASSAGRPGLAHAPGVAERRGQASGQPPQGTQLLLCARGPLLLEGGPNCWRAVNLPRFAMGPVSLQGRRKLFTSAKILSQTGKDTRVTGEDGPMVGAGTLNVHVSQSQGCTCRICGQSKALGSDRPPPPWVVIGGDCPARGSWWVTGGSSAPSPRSHSVA